MKPITKIRISNDRGWLRRAIWRTLGRRARLRAVIQGRVYLLKAPVDKEIICGRKTQEVDLTGTLECACLTLYRYRGREAR